MHGEVSAWLFGADVTTRLRVVHPPHVMMMMIRAAFELEERRPAFLASSCFFFMTPFVREPRKAPEGGVRVVFCWDPQP